MTNDGMAIRNCAIVIKVNDIAMNINVVVIAIKETRTNDNELVTLYMINEIGIASNGIAVQINAIAIHCRNR